MSGLAGNRVAGDEIVAGQSREAAEVHGVAELVAARLESLVTTRCHDKQIAARDRFGGALPKRDTHFACFKAMFFHLDRETGVRAGYKGELAARKPTVRERLETRHADQALAVYAEDRPLAAKFRHGDVERAA